MIRIALWVLALLGTGMVSAQTTDVSAPARLSVFVFESGAPVPAVDVRVGDVPSGSTNENGAWFVELSPMTYELSLWRNEALLRLPVELVPGEVMQVLVTLQESNPPRVLVESSHVDATAASIPEVPVVGRPGRLLGQVIDADDGSPLEGARIFVSGTPLDLRTDRDGRFAVDLPEGTYSVSFMSPDHATQTLDGIVISAEGETPLQVDLTPAGLELPEYVVLEPFVEGSLASVLDEQRTSAGVANVLGAEAISRAGDGDAAGALKRVTGLTLVGGQFIYVRGLGERYSSTLLNGANIPSPDPTRRVVPLDLFPADILASVVVQKSYDAHFPAEFGGGNINLRTAGIPESSYFKMSVSSAWHDQSTGEIGRTYAGGDDDFLGRDDGTRAFPNPDYEILETTPTALPNRYSPHDRHLQPDSNASLSAGYQGTLGGFDIGAIAVLSYDQSWRNRTEERNTYNVFVLNDEVRQRPEQQYDLEITRRFVDLGAYLSAGARYGEDHELNLNLLQLNSTEDETEIREGIEVEGDFIRETTLEWEERQLEAVQLFGQHRFPGLAGLEAEWLYSDASTRRDAPDERTYRYTRIGSSGDTFRFNLSSDGFSRNYAELDDEAENLALDLRLPLAFSRIELTPQIGYNTIEKSRDSFIRRFRFECRVVACRDRDLLQMPLEMILAPDNLSVDGTDGFRLFERTLATDAYFAEQSIDAWYLTLDATFRDRLRLNLGARQEQFDQRVVTFDRFNTDNQVASELNVDDLYPSVSATWTFGDGASQIRASYGETTTRPEFREVSTSLFTDPQLDLVVSGNPDLVPVQIENFDLRYEKYFDTIDNFSIALFHKKLANPIELVNQGGAAQRISIENAESAEISGVELEVYRGLGFLSGLADWAWLQGWPERFYMASNYTAIDSSIELGENQGRLTNSTRALQGQSDSVFNLQVGYDNPDRGIQATLLYNVTGERISFVGIEGAPDIVEVPFDQLDLVYNQRFLDDRLKLDIKLRNLLDDRVELRQGEDIFRAYEPGRELSFGLSWSF